MSEYIVYKKMPCAVHYKIDCNGTLGCLGYEMTPVDFDEVLLSRLAKLVWEETTSEYGTEIRDMKNPKYVEY